MLFYYLQSEPKVPVYMCKESAALVWKWEIPIYKTFWVAYVTCVTIQVGVTSSNYSNISTINSL
jgi:hypothetical protein